MTEPRNTPMFLCVELMWGAAKSANVARGRSRDMVDSTATRTSAGTKTQTQRCTHFRTQRFGVRCVRGLRPCAARERSAWLACTVMCWRTALCSKIQAPSAPKPSGEATLARCFRQHLWVRVSVFWHRSVCRRCPRMPAGRAEGWDMCIRRRLLTLQLP